jgi:hypothetical protein
MACLYKLLAVQCVNICSYYLQPDIYVYMTVFNRKWIRIPMLRNTAHCLTNDAVLNIQYDGLTFPQVEVVRFLDLQLDKQTTRRNQLHLLLNKLSKACFVLRRVRYVLDIDALTLVYFANFQSVVKYGIVFWGNSYNLNKDFLLQKRIRRMMLGLSYRSSCKLWFNLIS